MQRSSPSSPSARAVRALCVCLLCLLLLGNLPNSRAAGTGKPNILLITADDLGFQLGCYGDKIATTPNLDRLAREGARFTNAYVTSASCSPSRASLLTGLYPHQNGQLGLSHLGYSMRPGLPNLPALLKREGYRTGIIGKLHVEPEGDFPFDYKKIDIEPTRDKAAVRAMCDDFLGGPDDRPFFLYVNLFDPHHPFLRDVNGSPKVKVEPDQVHVFPFVGSNSPALRQETADYYTCVNRLDEIAGAVMESLREHGLDENTIVVFISDNGPPFPRGKCTSFEAGTHVPMIARWPGRIPPGVRGQLVNEVDLLPTFLRLAQAAPPDNLPGLSLLPLLENGAADWRERMATEFNSHEPRMINPQRAMREGRYKLIRTLLSDPAFDWPVPLEAYRAIQPDAGKGDFIQLYDMEADPHEFHNLAGSREHGAVLDHLTAALGEWGKATGDPLLDPAGLRAFVLSWKDALPTEVILEALIKKQNAAKKAGLEMPNTLTPAELDELRQRTQPPPTNTDP